MQRLIRGLEEPLHAARGLSDALLVLDQREAHVVVAVLAEADALTPVARAATRQSLLGCRYPQRVNCDYWLPFCDPQATPAQFLEEFRLWFAVLIFAGREEKEIIFFRKHRQPLTGGRNNKLNRFVHRVSLRDKLRCDGLLPKQPPYLGSLQI
jgi:hypothetical protein